jgi:ABC-type Fe3+-siderophore transport system permease subunit
LRHRRRLIAAAVARLPVPGKQDIFIPMTILLGIIRLLVGGFLGYLISRKDSPGGGLF